MKVEIFPGTFIQSVLSKVVRETKGASVQECSTVQSLIDSPVCLHQFLEEFDERGFDLSADLEHYSSVAIY